MKKKILNSVDILLKVFKTLSLYIIIATIIGVLWYIIINCNFFKDGEKLVMNIMMEELVLLLIIRIIKRVGKLPETLFIIIIMISIFGLFIVSMLSLFFYYNI